MAALKWPAIPPTPSDRAPTDRDGGDARWGSALDGTATPGFSALFSLNLRGLYGDDRQAWGLIGSLPRAPGGRWSSSLTLSYRDVPSQTDPDQVQETSTSASLEVTRTVNQQVFVQASYSYDDTASSALVPDPLLAPERTIQQGTLGAQFVHDGLDDPFDPRHGGSTSRPTSAGH